MGGSDEFLAGMPSMPHLESFNVAEFNIEEMPAFNMSSNFNLDGIGNSGDVESNEESACSSQERENALLSRKKKDAFDELSKRKETDDSSQETEINARKPPKSSMKRCSESCEKKNVEFVLPKKKAIPKKPRYGPDGREITEVEARAHDYFGEKKSPQMNFDVYRHRRNQQGKLSNEKKIA